MELDLSYCAYHSELGVKTVKTLGEFEALLKNGWCDTPAKFLEMEVVEKKPRKKRNVKEEIINEQSDSH